MDSSNEKKLDSGEVFDRWVADVREDRSARYTYQDRTRHLENLMGYLKMHDVSKDDAQFLKRKVVEILVTKEGMKNNGKHKGWKENTENDFDDLIQRTYVEGLRPTEIKAIRGSQGYDPKIVTWCKSKYGENVGADVIKAAHQPLHLFWIMFMEENFPDYIPKRRQA